MEWNFTYENQEASSFLVYQLEKEEQLDTVGMGMLSNNQIPHILPLLYTQIDEERYLRYAVPSRIPLDNYLEGMVSKDRLLNVLLEICEAVEEGQAYMLDSSKLVLDKRYIFANVSTGEVSLVYLPVFGRETSVELCNFFREIIFGTQFDSREDCSYIATIINYLNGDAHFIVTDFKKLLQTLLGQKSQPAVGRPTTAQSPVSSAKPPVQRPNGQPPAKPVPKSVAGKPVPRPSGTPAQHQPQMSVQKPVAIPPVQKTAAVPQAAPVQPQEKKGFSVKFPSKKAETPKAEKPSRQAGSPSIPIPGRENKKAAPAAPVKLAKSAKSAVPAKPTPPKPAAMAIPRQAPKPQGFTEVKAQPAEWGKSTHSANFGETSVLSREIGQTTVLSGGPQADRPAGAELIRKKTGQTIPVDKLLFRIGTEQSFVDYWVSDNTAVSHSHAAVINHEGAYYIRDNHSTNHTYVNGMLVSTGQEQILKDGDQILLGNEPFEFRQR